MQYAHFGSDRPSGEATITNVDQLRRQIDRGAGADKVAYSDPAAVPLGTDDEAAGHTPTVAEVQLEARTHIGSHVAASWPRNRLGLAIYFGALALVSSLVLGVVVLS